MRSTIMTTVTWIDLDVAAGWLSTKPEDVMTLVREGVLGSKRLSRDTFVVRADDVRSLARLWVPKRPRRRRAACARSTTDTRKSLSCLDSEHDKEGLTHRYRPVVSRQEATGSLLADFLRRFFHGSAEQLILGLVDAEHLSPDELGAIEDRLAQAGAGGGPEPAPVAPEQVIKRRRRKKS
jgi:hypothetical protein